MTLKPRDVAALLLITSLIGTSLSGPSAAAPNTTPKGLITIAGSSTVYPFSKAAIRSFAQRNPAAAKRFQARASGTSAGLREFCSGTLKIAAASRPINAREISSCNAAGVRYIELPIAFDAITVVVPRSNTWAQAISVEQLRTLWGREAQGLVKRWNQVKSSWPAKPIQLCGPGRESGTFDTFNKVINGSETNSRHDYTASEDDAVLVRCVAENPLALGYFGFDYFKANSRSLRALPIGGASGAVAPSEATVQKSLYQPLSRPLFFYVSDAGLKSDPAVRAFITSTLQRGGRIAKDAGVVPLEDATYRVVTNKLYRNVLGTAFGGNLPAGLSVGQILERSLDAHKKPQYR